MLFQSTNWKGLVMPITQTLIKLLVSGLLIFVVALCVRGLWRIWISHPLIVRPFTYVQDGTAKPDAGAHFTQLVLHDLRQLHRLLNPPQDEAEKLFEIPTVDQEGGYVGTFELPREARNPVPNVEIQAYGIQITTLINNLYQYVAPTNEIRGNVSERKKSFDVFVEIRQSDHMSEEVATRFVAQQSDLHEASFAVACRLYQALAEKSNPLYDQATEAEFEVFARALRHYQAYRAGIEEVRDEQATNKSLAETNRLLHGLLQQRSQWPLVCKLAALVANASGNVETAIKHLRKYQALLPDNMPDKAAADLLAKLEKQLKGRMAAMQAATDRGQRVRPVVPGVSVSSTQTSAGTLCCVVRGRTDKQLYLLSTYDIFQGSPGTPILQPGRADDGNSGKDKIAEMHRVLPLLPPPQVNRTAGALAKVLDKRAVDPINPKLPFRGIAAAHNGDTVRMLGRTSGLVQGKIVSVNSSPYVAAPSGGGLRFEGLIEVHGQGGPFSRPGDGGAPVVNSDDKLVGMLYASTRSGESTVLPIEAILESLDVELVISKDW